MAERTFWANSGWHGDYQRHFVYLQFKNYDPCDDGGVKYHFNGGKTVSTSNMLPTAQFSLSSIQTITFPYPHLSCRNTPGRTNLVCCDSSNLQPLEAVGISQRACGHLTQHSRRTGQAFSLALIQIDSFSSFLWSPGGAGGGIRKAALKNATFFFFFSVSNIALYEVQVDGQVDDCNQLQ